jgi:autotransporter-associated beta strand protein
LTLSGTSNTYTGATTVSAGTLRVNGNIASGSAVSVASGATLAGAGSVNGTVALSGNLAPGNGTVDAGTLNTGTTTWQDTGIFQFNLSSTDNTSDKLNITGNFNRGTAVGNTYVFNFMGSTPIENGVYTLASWSGSTTFTAENFTFTPGSLGGTFNSGSFSITGSNLQFTAIPEASNLLIGGLIGLGLLRRRRNGAAN